MLTAARTSRAVSTKSPTMDRMTEEALCDVQAQVYALRVAVRAIARTHPDPVALMAAWREALTEAATSNPVAPAGWRSSDDLAERMNACAEDWTAELVELAVPAPDRSSPNHDQPLDAARGSDAAY